MPYTFWNRKCSVCTHWDIDGVTPTLSVSSRASFTLSDIGEYPSTCATSRLTVRAMREKLKVSSDGDDSCSEKCESVMALMVGSSGVCMWREYGVRLSFLLLVLLAGI
jgi:hypothetical protein